MLHYCPILLLILGRIHGILSFNLNMNHPPSHHHPNHSKFTLSVSLPSQHHLQDHFFPYYYYLCHVLSFWSPSFAYQTLRPSPPASKLPFLLVHFTFLRMVPSHLLSSQQDFRVMCEVEKRTLFSTYCKASFASLFEYWK